MLPWTIKTPRQPILGGYGRLLGAVLAARGVENPESLLNPKECGPLKHTDSAAYLLKNSRKVLVAGDYDCDGLCGAAILFRALTECEIPAIVHIPTREEGYGFHKKQLIQHYLQVVISSSQLTAACPTRRQLTTRFRKASK